MRHFRLSIPDPTLKDKTRLQVLMDIKAQTGIEAPELKSLGVCPPATQHVWDWFCDLSRARTFGMTANPITWPEMSAYFGLMGIKPCRWEIEAVKRVDETFLDRGSLTESAGGAGALMTRMTHG